MEPHVWQGTLFVGVSWSLSFRGQQPCHTVSTCSKWKATEYKSRLQMAPPAASYSAVSFALDKQRGGYNGCQGFATLEN